MYGKNWKKVTQHVATRISAQVRSHAQKVLKDYSPNSQNHENGNASKSEDESSDQQEENHSLTHPKDHTMRTDEPNLPVKRLLIGHNTASNEGLEDECLTPDLNQNRKRYRKSVENTADNGGLDRF